MVPEREGKRRGRGGEENVESLLFTAERKRERKREERRPMNRVFFLLLSSFFIFFLLLLFFFFLLLSFSSSFLPLFFLFSSSYLSRLSDKSRYNSDLILPEDNKSFCSSSPSLKSTMPVLPLPSLPIIRFTFRRWSSRYRCLLPYPRRLILTSTATGWFQSRLCRAGLLSMLFHCRNFSRCRTRSASMRRCQKGSSAGGGGGT